MATIEQKSFATPRFVQNGANRPLHQDRQVLRASDLTLEQAAQDQMLARARRHLHGWGVVSGFAPAVAKLNDLFIGPGYGVTPLGDELFLPQKVELKDAYEALIRCCGLGPEGCEQIDPEIIAARRAEAANTAVTGWLIARPASRDAAPRAGVPQDCAHPASILLPSRRCGGVEFATICALPPTHQPRQPNCEELMPFVCGSGRSGASPLPWETPLPAEANFLVISRLIANSDGLTAITEGRRTLWPVSLMQDWIESCLCPLLSRDNTRPTVGGGATTVTGGTRGDIAPTRPSAVETIPGGTFPIDLIDLPPQVVVPPVGPPGPIPPERMGDLRDRLTAPVSEIAGVGAARTAALAVEGINTQGDFLAAPVEALATAMNLPTARVTAIKQRLSARHNLGLTFR